MRASPFSTQSSRTHFPRQRNPADQALRSRVFSAWAARALLTVFPALFLNMFNSAAATGNAENARLHNYTLSAIPTLCNGTRSEALKAPVHKQLLTDRAEHAEHESGPKAAISANPGGRAAAASRRAVSGNRVLSGTQPRTNRRPFHHRSHLDALAVDPQDPIRKAIALTGGAL